MGLKRQLRMCLKKKGNYCTTSEVAADTRGVQELKVASQEPISSRQVTVLVNSTKARFVVQLTSLSCTRDSESEAQRPPSRRGLFSRDLYDQMNSENGNQPKQERSRTRWTPALDKIFADLVVEQIKLGNRPNNVFDKKTWNHIRDEFNRRTDLNFNNNQLRKHLDVLRTRFCNMKSAFVQADFPVEDPCCIGFDLWDDIPGQSRPEMVKVKDGTIYEQLCTIFMDTSVHGKYAQSSHFEGLDKSVRNDATVFASCPGGTAPGKTAPSKLANVNNARTERVVKNKVERKRKQPPDNSLASELSRRDQETNQAIAEALQEIIAASRWRAELQTKSSEKFTITNCIKALDRIEGIEEQVYFSALDLFAEPSLRETFLSLKRNHLRLTWLQSKCGKPTTML